MPQPTAKSTRVTYLAVILGLLIAAQPLQAGAMHPPPLLARDVRLDPTIRTVALVQLGVGVVGLALGWSQVCPSCALAPHPPHPPPPPHQPHSSLSPGRHQTGACVF